ncbi:hypothetical protein, partial [Prosthecobacter sp.]|uniref:hypothetical protein n=1 Tax=Prosthecobacter sp. TaxID=1965333 RepID=UPI001DFEAC7E
MIIPSSNISQLPKSAVASVIRTRSLPILAGLCLAFGSPGLSADKPVFRAGAATSDITPSISAD